MTWTPHDRLRAGYALLLMTAYATVRPPVESLFLARHGSTALPAAWFAVAGVAAAASAVASRALRSRTAAQVLATATLASAALFGCLLLAGAAGFPLAEAALFVWKDVHIVVLVELFWAMNNSEVPPSRAPGLYGVLGLCGSLGGVVGNIAAGPLAAMTGGSGVSATLALPVLLCAALLARRLGALSTAPVAAHLRRPAVAEAVRTTWASAYLVPLAGMVACVQMALVQVDQVFHARLLLDLPDVDLRTAWLGQVYAATDGLAMLMHALSGLVLRGHGPAVLLAGAPVFVALVVAAASWLPGLGLVATAKILAKALDYAWLRSSKELLYAPLTPEEKTHGKMVAEMMTYRGARGAASLVLMGQLVWLGPMATWPALVTCVAWAGCAWTVLWRHRNNRISTTPRTD